MGSRGPLKRSASTEKLAGNPGKRKRAAKAGGAREEARPPAPVGCPEWLPPVAQEEWRRTLPLLKETLHPREVAAFACYCQSWADLRAASTAIESEGRTYVGPNGAICVHPAIKLAAAAMARIKAFAAQFGLTPATRPRVPEPEKPPEKDQLGEFLARGPNA